MHPMLHPCWPFLHSPKRSYLTLLFALRCPGNIFMSKCWVFSAVLSLKIPFVQGDYFLSCLLCDVDHHLLPSPLSYLLLPPSSFLLLLSLLLFSFLLSLPPPPPNLKTILLGFKRKTLRAGLKAQQRAITLRRTAHAADRVTWWGNTPLRVRKHLCVHTQLAYEEKREREIPLKAEWNSGAWMAQPPLQDWVDLVFEGSSLI